MRVKVRILKYKSSKCERKKVWLSYMTEKFENKM